MQQNDRNFDMTSIMQFASTPAGRQLIAILQQSDKTAMNAAMEQAKKGNYSQAKEVLSPLLASEEVQKLLKQMGG